MSSKLSIIKVCVALGIVRLISFTPNQLNTFSREGVDSPKKLRVGANSNFLETKSREPFSFLSSSSGCSSSSSALN